MARVREKKDEEREEGGGEELLYVLEGEVERTDWFEFCILGASCIKYFGEKLSEFCRR